ncbi:hypothetical protein DSO57_1029321 [Entomophthora muscae]|uniref:Uncharacterized protein n=1 Tax=Entomophthora muscae TaxID=34485 RepID=A0ACC2SEL0_9FUNG|nr:hypothetical protein DSO57_1029321 [Entomophthora muscae]
MKLCFSAVPFCIAIVAAIPRRGNLRIAATYGNGYGAKPEYPSAAVTPHQNYEPTHDSYRSHPSPDNYGNGDRYEGYGSGEPDHQGHRGARYSDIYRTVYDKAVSILTPAFTPNRV